MPWNFITAQASLCKCAQTTSPISYGGFSQLSLALSFPGLKGLNGVSSKFSTPTGSGMSLVLEILKTQVYRSIWVPKCMDLAEFQYLFTRQQSTQNKLASYLSRGEAGEHEFSSILTGYKDLGLNLHSSPWDTHSGSPSGASHTEATPESQTGARAPLSFRRLSLAGL